MRRIGLLVLVWGIAGSMVTRAFAGGGHLHGYSGGGEDSTTEKIVMLGNDAVTNLDIRTVEVKPEPPLIVRLGGVVEQRHDSVVTFSAPTNGAVTKIVAQPGKEIQRGETVAIFSPFQIGSSSFPLVSPIAGVVGSFSSALGAGCDQGEPLFTVIDPQLRVLVAPLTREIEISKVALGTPVAVFVGGESDRFSGKVYALERGPLGDLGSGRLTIELLPHAGAAPSLGATGAVLLVEEGGTPVFRLPREALVGTSADPVVFVRRGNRFERRSVVVSRDFGDLVEISRGLAAHESVVVRGAYQLHFARSDSPEKLTVGRHGGIVTTCAATSGERFSAEIKLHDDKGDLELWLGEGATLEKPLFVPLSSKLSLHFTSRNKTVAFSVRDEMSNKDEDGESHLKDGRADYFIFPGASGSDSTWLQGGDFVDEVTLSVERDGQMISCSLSTLVPHTHGGEEHSHSAETAGHSHDHHEDHGHSHDHDHGGGHSH